MTKQTLSKAQLKKHDNYITLLKKFFELPGYMNRYTTPDGIFIATALVVVENDNEMIAYETDEASDFNNIIKDIEKIINSTSRKDYIKITGQIDNTNQIKTIELKDLVKTPEFGGQGGKKENLGIRFENDYFESLDCFLNCECKTTPYKDSAHHLLEDIGKELKTGLAEVEAVGGKNQPRPLKGGSGGLYVEAGGIKTKDIGSTVTDITTKWGTGGKKEEYLSLKYGKTLTFINSGVGRIFLPEDYKNNFGYRNGAYLPTNKLPKGYSGFKNAIGKEIFKIFGIDPQLYADVFNKYNTSGYKGDKVNATNLADKRSIQDLLEYAIGYGYWMVHGGITGGVKFYQIDKDYMKKAAIISGSIEIHYGGSTGKGKRVDIHMESSVYKFMWNLRNKQSGLYPSHIMCDYKKK